MYYSKELPLRFKQESVSLGAGWINNSGVAHSWNRTQFFLLGLRNSSGMTNYDQGKGIFISIELYLGLWYVSLHMG